jgi:hypothetical protein
MASGFELTRKGFKAVHKSFEQVNKNHNDLVDIIGESFDGVQAQLDQIKFGIVGVRSD